MFEAVKVSDWNIQLRNSLLILRTEVLWNWVFLMPQNLYKTGRAPEMRTKLLEQFGMDLHHSIEKSSVIIFVPVISY